jgi:hypothetical protein
VEAACAIGYCGWHGEEIEQVGSVEEYFAKTCYACDCALRDPAGCRWFLNWFDEAPRDEVRRELSAEIAENIRDRFPEYFEPESKETVREQANC